MSTIIDLGKLRFNWVGPWNNATVYEYNDVVTHGGDAFVYIFASTSNGNDTTDTSYWGKINEGISWQGTWNASADYKLHEVVHHANNSYVCIADTTSNQSPPDATYWEILATGIQFEGEYDDTAGYDVHDVVYYGANTFVCIQNTSGGNNPTDVTYWNSFSHGVKWSSTYDNTSSYNKDDIVSYGGNTFIAKQNTVGNTPDDAANWETFSSGINYVGEWDVAVAYKTDDMVSHGGSIFIALSAAVAGTNPNANPGTWTKLTSGVEYRNDWDGSTAYKKDDIVSYGNGAYIAKQDSTGSNPASVIADWATLSSGTQFEGDYDNTAVYAEGDIVNYGNYTYVAKQGTTGNNPTDTANWNLMTKGISNTGAWVTGTDYVQDDLVSYGANSYTAAVDHTAAATFAADLSAGKLTKFSSGIDWKGTWTAGTFYKVDDIVSSGSSAYRSNTDHTADTLSNDAAYWDTIVTTDAIGVDLYASSDQGTIIYKGATATQELTPGIKGSVITSQGTNEDLVYASLFSLINMERDMTNSYAVAVFSGVGTDNISDYININAEGILEMDVTDGGVYSIDHATGNLYVDV